MIHNYSIWKVMRVFFDYPEAKEGFTIRHISKKIGLATTSVRLHLKELSRDDKDGYPLVTKSKGASYPVYRSNRSSDLFRFYKKMDIIFRLNESGLLDKIGEDIFPKCVILFGSASRGEDLEESDIDLFLLAKEYKIDLTKYEKILNRKISLHFSVDFNKLPKELRNNILNGIRLRGYLKVF